MSGEIRQLDHEIIGDHPYQETYEVYTISSKEMELQYFENTKQFHIFLQATGEKKVPGETTALFTEMVKKIQEKADELQEPVKLRLDPIVPVTRKWATTKAAEVVGGWDKIEYNIRNEETFLTKTFYPKNI